MLEFDDLNLVEAPRSARSDSTEFGMVLQLADGTITACDAIAEKLLGLTARQIQGWTSSDSPWQAIHADGTDFPGEAHPAMVALSTGQPQRGVVMGLYQPDGDLVWLKVDSQPLFQAPHATPYAVVSTFRQIPSPQRASLAPLESASSSESRSLPAFPPLLVLQEALTLFNLSADLLGTASLDGLFQTLNPAFQRTLGYSIGELIAQPLLNFVHPDDQAATIAELKKLNQGITVLSFTNRYRCKSGEYKWLDWTAVPGVDREIMYLMARDVTNLRQTEFALREAHIQLESALVAGSVYTWRWNISENLVTADRCFAQMFGVAPDAAAKGLPIEDFLNAMHPDDSPRVTAAIQQAIETGEEYAAEYRVRDAEGRERWVMARGRTEYDANGSAIAFPGALIHITDRKQAEATIQAQLAQIEAIYATAPVGLCFVDRDQRFVQINDRLAEMNGLSVADHLGRTMRDLLPDLANVLEPIFEQVLQTGVPVLDVEVSGTTPAQPGIDRTWLASYYPLNAANGDILGINVVVQEITERKAAEAALQESEFQNREILDSISDGFFALDTEWRFTYVNQAAEQMLGCSAADLIGKTIWEEFPGASGSEFGRIYRETMQNRTVESATAFYPDHDRWYEVRSYPAAQGITVYFKNITNQVEAEAALRQSEAFKHRLLESSPDCIKLLDLDGRLLYMNAGGLYTMEIDDFTPHCNVEWLSFWQGESRQEAERALELARVGELSVFRGYCPTLKGTPKWWEVIVSPLLDAAGQVEQILAISRDISDRRQAEAELQQLTASLRDSTNRLTLAIEAAQFGTWEVDLTVQPYVASPRSLRHDQIYGYESLQPHWDYETFISHIHENDRALVAEKFQQAITTGESWDVECRVRRADQTEGWIWIRGSIAQNEAGQPTRLLGLIADISDRKATEATLQQSEDRLRLALESTELGVWDNDLIANTATWDDRCRQMWGISSEVEVSMDLFFSGIHPDDRISTQAAVEQSFDPNGSGTYQTEYRVIGVEDGIIRWIAAKGQTYFDANRTPIRFTGTVLDISGEKRREAERQRDQAQLRDRQERLEAALSASETGTFRWNIRTNELDWDENLDRLFGLPPGQTARSLEAFIQMVHPDDRQGVIDRCARCASEAADFDMDFRAVYPDGSIHWLLDKGKTFFDEDGEPTYMTGACVDITDRKRIEADLWQKNALLNVINNSTPSPIYMKDRAGRITFANPATLEVLGKPESEVIGYRDDEIYPGLGEVVVENDRRIMETGEAEAIEESPDGIRTFFSVKTPYRDETGRVIGLIGVSNDITDRVQLERDREQILQQAQAAREASDRANRIKDEFLAVLSHELRSPLNPILGWSKMLKAGRLDAAKTQEAVLIIERNAQLQAQLIEDLLDVSRILQGKLTLKAEPVNLECVIASAQETVRLAAEAKHITISLQFERQIGQVLGDTGRLQQVVWNLLTNAVKFTPEGGQVTVKLARTNSQAQIQVIDTGRGISPEFLPHVFERFTQADSSTTRKHGGLGLGLAIVRQLVELHGGTIEVESSGEGRGATFTVLLPLLKSPNESPAEILNLVDLDCPESDPLRGSRILVVDDDSDSREFVAFVLEQSGAIVTQAASAQEALAFLSSAPFDVLASDIGMPEMNGYGLIQQVRARTPEQGGQIPALALTAYASEQDAQQALEAGFEQHIAKPVDPSRLVSVVAELINQ